MLRIYLLTFFFHILSCICLQSKTSTTIAVTLTEPTVKNGIIRKYSVIVNNTVVSIYIYDISYINQKVAA